MARVLPVFLLWLLGAVPDHPGPPIPLTAEEDATLARHEIVSRYEPGGESGGGAVGVVDVNAPVDATWKAVLDVEARVGEVSGLQSCKKYVDDQTPTGGRIAARWEVRILLSTLVFHVVYELDPANRFVRFHLDPTQPNDLEKVEGAYHLVPTATGTRFEYWSTVESGHAEPQWLKKWLASESLSAQLSGIRDRAEKAPR